MTDQDQQPILDPDLRVTEIGVRGLFGMYDHTIKLNNDERITIIHGPNGVGKTVLLRLTSAVLNGRYTKSVKVPFDEFYVLFNDEEKIGLKKSETGTEFFLISKNGKRSSTLAENLDVKRLAVLIGKEVPYLRQMDDELWMDRRTEEMISSSDVVERHADLLPNSNLDKVFKKIPKLRELQKKLKAHLIETQRLIKFSSSRLMNRVTPRNVQSIVDTVTEYSLDLQERIEKSLADYGRESQLLDQSFPQRLIQFSKEPKSINEIKSDFADIDKQRDDLKKIGLLVDDVSAAQFDLNKINENQRPVMTLYIEDTQKKLNTLKNLARRVDILLNNINAKFKLTNKFINIDRKSGLMVKINNDDELSLEVLSSGEQHEIVLLYDLLFKTEKNALVMIDEPELSLHVSWQKSFVKDLLEIIKIAEFDVILATHSPYIVGKYSNLMVALTSDQHQVAE